MSARIGSFWDVVSAPFEWAAGAVVSVADALVTAAHVLPGVDWAGDELKDFSRTSFGATFITVLGTALTSGLYLETSESLSAYTALAPQLASLVFAFPQMANGNKRFFSAYASELLLRVKQTAQFVSPAAGAALGAAIQPALSEILSNPYVQQLVAAGTDLQAITKELKALGVPDVTAYATQKALDLLRQANDAGKKFFDNFGNEIDAAGNPIAGATAEGAAFAKKKALAMSVAAYEEALRVQKATTTHMQRAGNAFLDELDASSYMPAAVPALVSSAPRAQPAVVAVGVGITALLALAIVRFL